MNKSITEYEHVIFDLDGTLIDSAGSILYCIKKAMISCGLVPVIPLEKTLIGPPLRTIFTNIIGTDDSDILDPVIEKFQEYYDIKCVEVKEYPDTTVFLSHLCSKGHTIWLATNKRMGPTLKIIKHMQWERYFKGIYTLDMGGRELKTKAELLQNLLKEQNIKNCVYVGDRDSDGHAAFFNNIPFILVNWGYNK